MQKNLEEENKLLKMELDESKNNYKKLSLKIGKLIFQNEEYEREIKNLKEKITQLEQENNKLKNIQKENKWNLKSLINI